MSDSTADPAGTATTLPASHARRLSDGGCDAEGYAQVALLDHRGVVVAVNRAWDDFRVANPEELVSCGVGSSYLDACSAGRRDPSAMDAGAAVRSALAGHLPSPATLFIPGDAPGEPRWFDLLVSTRRDEDGELLGATVSLSLRQESARSLDAAGDSLLPGLEFPDLRRGEMQEILTRLTVGAHDLNTARDRLQALLRANAVVSGELSLPLVLRHLVSLARDLAGARYAALGVVAADGSIEQFVHDGMDDSTVAEIGHLSRGLLDLSTHPASVSDPPRHPPMATFLGMQIRVRGQLFGNLYLTESIHGAFTAEDEVLVTALADAAGVAIANARLYEDSERRRRWQVASTEVTQALAGHPGDRPLDVVLRGAMGAAEADFVVVVAATGDQLRAEAAAGGLSAALAEELPDLASSMIRPVLVDGESVLVERYRSTVDEATAPARQRVGSLLGAPLRDGDGVWAALVAGREVGRAPFVAADTDQLADFAGHVSLSLERIQGAR